MKVALLNAHTAYAFGASCTINGLLYSEYKLSRQINSAILPKLQGYSIDTIIIDGSNEKPYNKSLRYKTNLVNEENADIAIETHFNSAFSAAFASMSKGTEVIYYPDSTKGKELAQVLAESFRTFLPFVMRRGGSGLHTSSKLHVLKAIECPTIITEICFLSNPIDRLYLLHPRSTDIIANATVDGILKYKQLTSL